MKTILATAAIFPLLLFSACSAGNESAPPPIDAGHPESSLAAPAEAARSEGASEDTSLSPSASEDTAQSQPFQTDNEPIAIEADYVPTGEQQHSIMNPRFRFALTMPNTWKAFDRSANGDGYFIDCGNPAIDIRVYGRYEVVPIEEEQSGDAFAFASGQTGWALQSPGESIHYFYLADERIITFYVGYEDDEQWYDEHRDALALIAATLRDTQ